MADCAKRGGKTINLKKTMDVALKDCPTVKTVFVDQRDQDKKLELGRRDVLLKEVTFMTWSIFRTVYKLMRPLVVTLRYDLGGHQRPKMLVKYKNTVPS